MVVTVKNRHAAITNDGLRMSLSAARWPFMTCSPTLPMAGGRRTSRFTYRPLSPVDLSSAPRLGSLRILTRVN